MSRVKPGAAGDYCRDEVCPNAIAEHRGSLFNPLKYIAFEVFRSGRYVSRPVTLKVDAGLKGHSGPAVAAADLPGAKGARVRFEIPCFRGRGA